MQGRMRNTNRIRGNTLIICVYTRINAEYAGNTRRIRTEHAGTHREYTGNTQRTCEFSFLFKDPVSKVVPSRNAKNTQGICGEYAMNAWTIQEEYARSRGEYAGNTHGIHREYVENTQE